MSTSDVYQLAKAELAQCEARAERLRTFISTYEELVAQREVDGNSPRMTAAPVAAEDGLVALDRVVQHASEAPLHKRNATSPEHTEQVAVAIIAERGHPVQRGELFDEATKRGVVIIGKNPLNAFGTRLSRSSRIKNVAGKGYWLTDRPLPDEQTTSSDSEPALFESNAGSTLG